jgi:DNA invertase Pin-like site-specific DNA recombinase
MGIDHNTIPAAAYVRTAHVHQEGSLDRQRMEITKLAERDNYQIVRWYEDAGFSGVDSARRPAFQQMLTDAEAGHFQTILIEDLSRFSREESFTVAHHLERLRKANVELVSCEGGRLHREGLIQAFAAIADRLKQGSRGEGRAT